MAKTTNNRRSEFYVYRVVREKSPEKINEPTEEKKEDSFIISPRFGKQEKIIHDNSIGYHRDPKLYDSIRPDRKLRQESYGLHNKPTTEEQAKGVEKNIKTDDVVYDNINYNEETINHSIDDIPLDAFDNYDYHLDVKKTSKQQPKSFIPVREEKQIVKPINEKQETTIITPPTKMSVNIGQKVTKYVYPKIEFLDHNQESSNNDIAEAERQKAIIDRTFKESNIKASVETYLFGPTVTQFLIKVEPGINVKIISSIESNLAMYLEAEAIRIQTPIPGKPFAGIEVPKKTENRKIVHLGDLLKANNFKNSKFVLPIAVGQDNYGTQMFIDIAEMPHGLIAGTTKSGKSVCLNTILLSLIYKFSPRDLRLVLIDPKRIELGAYEGIPHLAMPVITDQEDFCAALSWLVDEMERRYEVFAYYDERNISDLNQHLIAERKPKLPYIVMIMDEFSDWITSAGQEVENMLQRIAQKARAAGIHIILAAQRPSKDVIKGTIKANFDTRLAFKVSSFEDSKVILGNGGAEKLEGYGDMLIRYAGHPEKRLQGAFVNNGDIKKIVKFLKENNTLDYLVTKEELRQSSASRQVGTAKQLGTEDDIFEEVAYYVVRNQNASLNSLQRQFGTGFNRMNDIFLGLEDLGIVSKTAKGKSREVLVSEFDLEKILENK